MASTKSCLFEFLVVILKLLEIACSLLKLAATALGRRLNSRHGTDASHTPVVAVIPDTGPVHIPRAASVTSNELCATCQGIIDIISHPGWHKDLVHHESLASLESSSEQYCGICTETLQYIRRRCNDSFEALFPMKCESDTSSASWQSSFELTLTTSGRVEFILPFTFEIMKQSQSEYAEYIPCSSTDSPESWALVARWMHVCTQTHDRCNAAIPERWFPSRVLDVGTVKDDYIRLVLAEDVVPRQPYATLSHCWGKHRIILTMTATVQAHLTRIEMRRLPKTFADAVGIARRLGLRYLWIDALCIVQDSMSDWSYESDLMSKVYRYSFINIAATGSEDSFGGCFWGRDPRTILQTQSLINWIGCTGDSMKRYLVISDPNVWAQKLTHEPLNKRAWVLQERVLSPRVVHFAQQQLFWECRQFVACETYWGGLPDSVRGHTSIDIKKLQLGDETRDNRWPAKYTSRDSLGVGPMKRLLDALIDKLRPVLVQEVTIHAAMKTASVFQDWDAIVKLYTELRITFATDKLVALAGIASSVSNIETGAPGDGYLAGLWQSSLPAYLLWKTETGDFPRVLPTRWGEYIAPTWSWASISGKISLAFCQHNYNPNDYLAVLQEAFVAHRDGYRFGRVRDGFVQLSGPIASVLWAVNHMTHSLPDLMTARITQIFPQMLGSHVPVSVASESSTDPEIFFDTALEDDTPSLARSPGIDIIPKDQVLTLLPIIGVKKRSAHEIETVIGLVLIPARHKTEMYERVGIFFTTRLQVRRILTNMPQRSITII